MFIEFHHRAPYAAGGRATVDNIELRCRAHNTYEAEVFFGPARRYLPVAARAGSLPSTVSALTHFRSGTAEHEIGHLDERMGRPWLTAEDWRTPPRTVGRPPVPPS